MKKGPPNSKATPYAQFFNSMVPSALVRMEGEEVKAETLKEKGIDEKAIIPMILGQFNLVQLCVRKILDVAVFNNSRGSGPTAYMLRHKAMPPR